MSIKLKVKSKSLSEEARIIRKEERKQLGYSRYCRTTNEHDYRPSFKEFLELQQHRTGVVREEARVTHLARAYLKGRSYVSTECPKKPLPKYLLNRLTKLLGRYSEDMYEGDVINWINDGR